MTKILLFVSSLPMVVGMCQGGKAPQVRPPQRLDVIMTSQTPQRDCDRMGGRLVGLVCQDVDY